LQRASARLIRVWFKRMDREVEERSAAGIKVWAALLFNSDGMGEIS